jgi:transposase-like protein
MPPHRPAILPRWARRTPSLDVLLPVLYLRGVAMGDFQEALAALLGKEAPNLSPLAVAQLRDRWQADYARWQRRDLSARHYAYLWADGIYLQARMGPQAECMLVLIGTTPEGRKELVGFQVGMRESAQSGRELLVEPQGTRPGDRTAAGHRRRRPGLWKALDAVFPTTWHQRCWMHKAANVLDRLQKSVQPAAKQDLHEVWQAPDRATAETAIGTSAEKYAAKYEKVVSCLLKERNTMRAISINPNLRSFLTGGYIHSQTASALDTEGCWGSADARRRERRPRPDCRSVTLCRQARSRRRLAPPSCCRRNLRSA